jgi:hypothetical protein
MDSVNGRISATSSSRLLRRRNRFEAAGINGEPGVCILY